MRIHRRTVLQAMLVLPVATLATRSQKVCALPHLTHSSPQGGFIVELYFKQCSFYLLRRSRLVAKRYAPYRI